MWNELRYSFSGMVSLAYIYGLHSLVKYFIKKKIKLINLYYIISLVVGAVLAFILVHKVLIPILT